MIDFPKRLDDRTGTEPAGRAFFTVSPEVLAQLFRFPRGCRVDMVTYDHMRDTHMVYISGPELPMTPAGTPIEQIRPMYQRYCVQAGEIAEQNAEKITLVSF